MQVQLLMQQLRGAKSHFSLTKIAGSVPEFGGSGYKQFPKLAAFALLCLTQSPLLGRTSDIEANKSTI